MTSLLFMSLPISIDSCFLPSVSPWVLPAGVKHNEIRIISSHASECAELSRGQEGMLPSHSALKNCPGDLEGLVSCADSMTQWLQVLT